MARKSGTFSGRNYVDFYGTPELLKKIEKMGANVNKAVEDACIAGSEPVQNDLLAFIRKHHLTGTTEDSYNHGKAVWVSDTIMQYNFGFDVKKGGLPALFLDIGTPKIKPSFFVYYASQKNYHKIMQLQYDALEKSVLSQIKEFES